MNRGEIWFAQVGRKRRSVLVLTRSEVIEVRALVTVAEVTTSIRGIGAEVDLDQAASVSDETMARVCAAVSYALGC